MGVPVDSAGTVVLVLNELVANAMLHGSSGVGDEVEVEVTYQPDGRSGGTVRVAVTDRCPQHRPTLRTAGLDEGGRGIVLVAALASDWACSTSADTKTVSACIPLADATLGPVSGVAGASVACPATGAEVP